MVFQCFGGLQLAACQAAAALDSQDQCPAPVEASSGLGRTTGDGRSFYVRSKLLQASAPSTPCILTIQMALGCLMKHAWDGHLYSIVHRIECARPRRLPR